MGSQLSRQSCQRLKSAWGTGGLWELPGPSPHCDHIWVLQQVFYTQPLLHPSEDRLLPVSTTLPIRLSSRACWAPDEAARLMVIHRDDSGVHLAITTFELKATKSRDRVSILGKVPCWPQPSFGTSGQAAHGSSRTVSFPFQGKRGRGAWTLCCVFHVLGGGMLSTCWSPCGAGLQK